MKDDYEKLRASIKMFSQMVMESTEKDLSLLLMIDDSITEVLALVKCKIGLLVTSNLNVFDQLEIKVNVFDYIEKLKEDIMQLENHECISNYNHNNNKKEFLN